MFHLGLVIGGRMSHFQGRGVARVWRGLGVLLDLTFLAGVSILAGVMGVPEDLGSFMRVM